MSRNAAPYRRLSIRSSFAAADESATRRRPALCWDWGCAAAVVAGAAVLSFESPRLKASVAYDGTVAVSPTAAAEIPAPGRPPFRSDGDMKGRGDFPVGHMSYADAVAYATGTDKRLPTEAKCEFAARGGIEARLYSWGNELTPDGKWLANVYQGTFPIQGSGEDGYSGLAPAAQFPPSGYGRRDMAGGVWEWCNDTSCGDDTRSERAPVA